MSTNLPQHGFFVFCMMDKDVGYHVHATRGHFRNLQDAQHFCKGIDKGRNPIILCAQSLIVIEDQWYRKTVNWTDQ